MEAGPESRAFFVSLRTSSSTLRHYFVYHYFVTWLQFLCFIDEEEKYKIYMMYQPYAMLRETTERDD